MARIGQLLAPVRLPACGSGEPRYIAALLWAQLCSSGFTTLPTTKLTKRYGRRILSNPNVGRIRRFGPRIG